MNHPNSQYASTGRCEKYRRTRASIAPRSVFHRHGNSAAVGTVDVDGRLRTPVKPNLRLNVALIQSCPQGSTRERLVS
jgi:hypothetical protein